MFSSVNRWIHSAKHKHVFNRCLGEENNEWKKTVLNSGNKTESFIKYYVKKLTDGQRRFYHHIFAMKDQRNRNIYQLVFVTQHLDRLISIKRAMIKNFQETVNFIYSELVENHPE